MNDIHSLNPKSVWKHFYTLTQTPRPSHHEERVIKAIADLAEKFGLDYSIDKVGNLIVRKPAQNSTTENKVIFQSHVDMVPQKNNDKVHDFLTDPISTRVEGEWMKADDTTLGADNGMGVAAMMAVMEDSKMSHGSLEFLFTINEEAGMEGALGLANNALSGDILINLDTEEEGEICIGCAGGMDANISKKYETVKLSNPTLVSVEIKGLKGGHSGIDIHLGRGNANKIMGRLLYSLVQNFEDLQLASLQGGNMRNAIPREGSFTIAVNAEHKVGIEQTIYSFNELLKQELGNIEPDLNISLVEPGAEQNALTVEDTNEIIASLNACPNGVLRMNDSVSDLVETSVNLSIVKVFDGNVEVKLLIRSSVDSAKYAAGDQLKALFELIGADVSFGGDYPGWAPNSNSEVLKVCQETFKDMYKKEPHVVAVHAGLECGIIGGKYSNLDMISFGPTITHPHSPDEAVHIPSVERFWEFLKLVLSNIK